MDTVVKLLMNILSRTFEFQAGMFLVTHFCCNADPFVDAFAVKLGYSTELAKSLIKLQIQNLSTMDADWMYSSYHFSHPILPERLGALGWYGSDKKADLKAEDSDKPIKAEDREL